MNGVAKLSLRGIAQIILGAVVLGTAFFLFSMSSRTGQNRFEGTQAMLDGIAAANTRLDGALFPLLFEFRTDLDDITAAEQELSARAVEYMQLDESTGAEELLELVNEKLALIEDFKSQQAVARNSRAIAAEMLEALWTKGDASTVDAQRELFRLERAYLAFVTRRDPASAAALRTSIEAQVDAGREWVAAREWPTFEAHADTLMRYTELLTGLIGMIYTVPVNAALTDGETLSQDEYARASALAGTYRLALLAVAVVLLAFSGFKVWEVGRYLTLIRRANDDLERRVEDRTQELSAANTALHTQMREREEIEVQLRLAQKLESLGQLAAGIAHEINTPAQYVSDNVSFLSTAWVDLTKLFAEYDRSLLKGEIDPSRSRKLWEDADVEYLAGEVPQALQQVTAGLQQISHIVRAMKDFSHPGEEGLRPADLNRAIESTITVARNEWKYVAELTLDLDGTLPMVPCNVSAINQVILNIVVNAAHAISATLEPGELGRIWVSSRKNGAYAEITIEDNGPGIPEAIRDKIFDPFFTTKPVGKGTGQGLAIAFRVVHQQHSGTLSVTTGRGDRGAKFVIQLLLEAAADDAPAARSAAG